MTHNPRANIAGARGWKPEEDDTLCLLQQGWTYAEVATLLGNRTPDSVKSRYKWLGLSIEKRRERARTRRFRAQAANPDVTIIRREIVPAHVLEDRNRRYQAQRSLTAILMGDPCR